MPISEGKARIEPGNRSMLLRMIIPMDPEPGGSKAMEPMMYSQSSEGYGAAFKPSDSYPSPSPKCQEPANEGSVAASELPIS